MADTPRGGFARVTQHPDFETDLNFEKPKAEEPAADDDQPGLLVRPAT